MQLTKIDFNSLNGRQKEIFNFQKVAGLLADYGFNCMKLSDDWHGADFLAYHKDGMDTLKVQLKSRPAIYKTYLGKELFIAFPLNNHWYLVEHDILVDKAGQFTKWLQSDSWVKEGGYSSTTLNPAFLESLSGNRL